MTAIQDTDEKALQALRRQMSEILRGEDPARTIPIAPLPAASPQLREPELGNCRKSPSHALGENSVADGHEKFYPRAPASLAEAKLTDSEVESLILKYLVQVRIAQGAAIAKQVALPFTIVERVLARLKEQRLLTYKNTSSLHDFNYEITDEGVDRGRRWTEQCTYFGAAPVNLSDYAAAVSAQSIHRLRVQPEDVRKAFRDLTLSQVMLERIGRAVRSGKGLFLYGAPGNGKTCIAERITKAYGQSIWIPRALNFFGEIIRLFDPSVHVHIPLSEGSSIVDSDKLDQRWVRIQRPTIVVGGELTMDSLEIRIDRQTGISEAPVQLKSNCGTLVIDDFGRQRIAPAELLNRWIVPLEKRYDFLTVASGRKVQVPFNQFVIFSTNLEPRDLVDEAFLRRIPYKIDVPDPTEEQFQTLFMALASRARIACSPADFEYFIEHCYRRVSRPMRFCHARDMLDQIAVYSDYGGGAPRVSREAIEAAASNYFSMV